MVLAFLEPWPKRLDVWKCHMSRIHLVLRFEEPFPCIVKLCEFCYGGKKQRKTGNLCYHHFDVKK